MMNHATRRHRAARHALCLALAAGLAAGAHAQLAEKPSAFVAQRRGLHLQSVGDPAAPPYLEHIDSPAQFRRLARVYAAGSAHAVVHTLFALDRAQGDRLYYINAGRYPLHEDFLRRQYLVPGLDAKTMAGYYARPDRRFVLGTIGLQPDLRQWVFELWEGDRITPPLLQLLQQRLARSFFTEVRFKANSAQQEAAAREAGIDYVTEAQILGERSFLPLNTGSAVGRLRRVADIEAEQEDDIAPTDIVVLQQVPLALPPVAGVLSERPSTVLSHVNLLAKGWGVPNAYVKDAGELLQRYEGRWVRLTVEDTGYRVEPATAPAQARRPPAATVLRPPNLSRASLAPLQALRAGDADACGGKAAKLGEVEAARRTGRLTGVAPVPDGYCIPYAQYAAFIRQPEVARRIEAAYATPGFAHSRRVRRQALEALRQDLVEMPVDPAQAAAWAAAWQRQLGGAGVFVRSSSNSEDLANFSGAGLYSTVPNVKEAGQLQRAVKAVWASVFNFEAHEARVQAGIASDQVVMAVFVQRAVDAVNAGVLITRDPFDATHRGVVYVSAKRGLGIQVVEGRRVAEQSMWEARSGAVRRLSYSEDDTALRLGEQGGVEQVALPARHEVLSEPMVKALARVGGQLKRLLGGIDQDVEWAVDPQGRIVVLQARPYVERKAL